MKRGSPKIVLGQIQTLYTLVTLGERVRCPVAGAIHHSAEDAAEDAFADSSCIAHGPMVLSVCRRMLPSAHDAEDAFQATFLILARRAAFDRTARAIGELALWRRGPGGQEARRARSDSTQGKAELMNESHVEVVNAPDESRDPLPARRGVEPPAAALRIAPVACELEGKSRREAAIQIGVPEGTLSTRLARRRKSFKAIAYGAVSALERGRSPGLAEASHHSDRRFRAAGRFHTVLAALAYASRRFAAGTVPATVASLAEGVLNMMLMTPIAALILIASMMAVAGSLLATSDPSKSELKKYQGNWVLVAEESEGKTVPAAELPGPLLLHRPR